MAAAILDGKKLAKEIVAGLKEKLSPMLTRPKLAIIMVGNNPASEVYVGKKMELCEELGMACEKLALPEETQEPELLGKLNELNEDSSVHGILVQLPLPKHINEQFILESIKPTKDVDGFTPLNIGSLMVGTPLLVPATPRGIMKLIESTGIGIAGKHAVVVGRSTIVGKPVAHLLLEKNATVTICHSKTKHIEKFTKDADILVVAAGKPAMIKKDMVKEGAVVIDVGTTRGSDGKLQGDVDFEAVKEVVGFLTPVPGGVGPMTVACLMENVVKAQELLSK